jgi:outer membrane immunogenic protein
VTVAGVQQLFSARDVTIVRTVLVRGIVMKNLRHAHFGAANLGAAFAVAAFSAGAALAADMPLKAPLYQAPPALYSWTGFYLGANLGVGVARDPSALSFPAVGAPAGGGPEFFNAQPVGILGGFQAGYNWQFSNWVVGIESDIQGSAQSDSQTCLNGNCGPMLFSTVKQEMPWLGTTRGRIGYANGPILSYFTAGAAYGEAQTSININNTAITGDAATLNLSSTRVGWTYGTGVEVALDSNWTAKAEYLYVDLGSQRGMVTLAPSGTTSVFNTRFQEQVFRGGVNYRWGGGGAPWPDQVMNWSGLYLGANLGYGLARNPDTLNIAPDPPFTFSEKFNLAPHGVVGGVQGGYNWQVARWVLGLETDIQGADQDDHQTCVAACDLVFGNSIISVEQKLNWFGTTRGRLGYAFGPSLLYGTAGLAYGGVKEHINETVVGFPTVTFDFNHTLVGWAAGAGIETKASLFGLLGPNWMMRTEYLYVDLGSVNDTYSFVGAVHALTGSVHDHVWRSALTYRFGG